MAVCFLLHWPSVDLEVNIPGVTRHTVLWSSDFPPPPKGGGDHPARLLCISIAIRRFRRLLLKEHATANQESVKNPGHSYTVFHHTPW